MTKTLILAFHPDLARSRANAAMLGAAARLPDVEIADLYGLYPDGRIDADREVARLLSADRVVLQFPVQWYATPALLKAWQDLILTRMFYLAYDAEGRRLEGAPLLVAATAGNTPEAYGPGGMNLYPLDDLLKPLRATANRCGLPWTEPFLAYRANRLSDGEIADLAMRYAGRLSAWIAATPRARAETAMALRA